MFIDEKMQKICQKHFHENLGSTKSKSPSDFVGSIQFMSPELMDGEIINYKKADVYAFGMTMYSILCDKIPFYD